MTLSFSAAPRHICILRLSAVGDICHTLPVVRTIQAHWPDTRITWIIGKTEHSLVGDIANITFVIFDKNQGFGAYRSIHKALRNTQFDALLHMQMSIRSSMVNRLVKSNVRIGFDRARAKDLQWLFNNHRIPGHKNQHVMDSFFGFSEALGISSRRLEWDIPISSELRQQAENLVKGSPRFLVISPCSSMSYRNWHAQGYANVCDYAYKRHNLHTILCGGPTPIEHQTGMDIVQFAQHKPNNLIGRTSLKELLVLLENAVAVVSPDSGPAHMATAVSTPVIGLYACTNPDRARPYSSAEYVVNKYPEAVKRKYAKEVENLPWGIRVRDAWAMAMIQTEEVMEKLDLLMSRVNNASAHP